MTSARLGTQSFVIPDEPDFARMHRDISVRLRAAMADHGVDAMILLMNDNVVYAPAPAGRCSTPGCHTWNGRSR